VEERKDQRYGWSYGCIWMFREERESKREREGGREMERENQWMMIYEETRETREKWDGEGEEVRRNGGGRGDGVHE